MSIDIIYSYKNRILYPNFSELYRISLLFRVSYFRSLCIQYAIYIFPLLRSLQVAPEIRSFFSLRPRSPWANSSAPPSPAWPPGQEGSSALP